ncbi:MULTISPECIES: thiamine pyrophosphate-binding protein [unclassified Microbacterium]|uniref:thiamine pyrophosphate-binding protein n=1 Tax=unclassified Microbacterium TaxID=2609290 RepID=UPI00214ACA81|nr:MULTISPECIES: thiamine pyrophosphate-binding protein [unclassified Microbacterium]MCR2811385.1 thiamine pyrophosphate-binding protein [Microbacterium sp. zg.B185]WIM19569.1 thiamine pyrophosphate-binding protein [Microbacterium sp. zg-B185]
MGQITVAQAIARLLEKMGTEVAFGLNGHGNWALLDALVHDTKIHTVNTRSEDHAVELADGYWRRKRSVPLPIVTTSVGPGNMNTVPPIATAFYESIGMLLIAGVGATHWFDRGGIEEFYRHGPEDWAGVMRPITKKSVMVTRPDTAIDMFLRAYQTAHTGRPGPVVLAIPYDIQNTLISDELPDPRPYMAHRPPAPDPSGIADAIRVLQKAERPLLVVGSGIANSRAWDALREYAEATGTPVAVTSAGKAAFPEDHRLSVGGIGRAGTGHGNDAARRADVVIGIGTHFTDIDTGAWTLFDIPTNTKLIHIDIDPTELGRAYPTEVALFSDARLGLEALTRAAREAGLTEREAWTTELTAKGAEWFESTQDMRNSEIAPIHYARITWDTGQVVAEKCPNASIHFDTGNMLSFGPSFLPASSRNVVHSSYMHRMGWSAASVLGASLASGKGPAIAMLGDGAFLMRATVVPTAVELGLPIIWIVFDNRSLQIERETMLRLFGRESLCDYRKEGEQALWGPDYVAMAKAMGAEGVNISHPDDFKPALEAALESGRPTLINIETEIETPQWRAIWYPYPDNFDATWKAGPLDESAAQH